MLGSGPRMQHKELGEWVAVAGTCPGQGDYEVRPNQDEIGRSPRDNKPTKLDFGGVRQAWLVSKRVRAL